MKRLDQLKASKTKELFLKKQKELETTCNISHMETPSTEVGDIINLVDSGESLLTVTFCNCLVFNIFIHSWESFNLTLIR